jgi:hypothetical protein
LDNKAKRDRKEQRWLKRAVERGASDARTTSATAETVVFSRMIPGDLLSLFLPPFFFRSTLTFCFVVDHSLVLHPWKVNW